MKWTGRTKKASPRSLVRTLALSVIAGLCIGLFYVWQFQFSVVALEASLAAGVGFAVVVGIVTYVFGPLSGIWLYVTAALAGAASGSLWWVVLRPNASAFTVAAIGALVALVVTAGEIRGGYPSGSRAS